jgi:hypothetical protein
MGITEEKARGLRAAAARTLLYRNPERLPELLAADLDQRSRDYLIVASLRQLYGTDPAKAVAVRDQIGLSADMDGLWGKALAEAPSNGPPMHLDSPSQLGEIASWSGDDKCRAVVKMQAWDEGQIQQSLKVFESLPDGDRRSLAEILSGLKGDPAPMPLRAESIRYLMTDQGAAVVKDDQNFRYFCEFAGKWGGDEPATAARWVESLPTGEKRLWMAKNVAASWGLYNPQAAAKWVDSLGLKEQLEKLGK